MTRNLSPCVPNFAAFPSEPKVRNAQRVGGGGGEFLWYGPPASMTSRLASVTFKMASKVFIEETDKNFDFITEILFRFLGFGDFKVYCHRKLDLSTFLE